MAHSNSLISSYLQDDVTRGRVTRILAVVADPPRSFVVTEHRSGEHWAYLDQDAADDTGEVCRLIPSVWRGREREYLLAPEEGAPS
jgi:hypothetical protein